MAIHPDRRWLTKQYLVFMTITVLLAVLAGVTHLVLALAVGDVDERSLGVSLTWLVAGGLAVLLWLIGVPAVILWFRNLEYVIEEERIIIRKGVLTKIQQNIPMAMVTDFRLQRTLYDRALRLGSIQVQTAGQGTTATGYEGKMAGVSDWNTLHEDLRARIKSLDRRARSETRPDEIHAILDEVQRIRRSLESAR
ncbi:MAG: PH domain-containing protein [Acidimicrobiia bacterium]